MAFGVVVASVLAPRASVTLAHGGGLNADGCHRDTSSGTYHCHGAPPSVPAPVTMPPSMPDAEPRERTFSDEHPLIVLILGLGGMGAFAAAGAGVLWWGLKR